MCVETLHGIPKAKATVKTKSGLQCESNVCEVTAGSLVRVQLGEPLYFKLEQPLLVLYADGRIGFVARFDRD